MLMPGAEGFEVLRAVRAIARDARFIMISGASGDFSDILGQAPMLGADAILQKPFAPEELLDLIDAVCVGGQGDRKSVVEGKSVSVRVDLGGRRIIKKKKKQT